MIDSTQPFLMAVQGMQVRGVSETGAQEFLKRLTGNSYHSP